LHSYSFFGSSKKTPTFPKTRCYKKVGFRFFSFPVAARKTYTRTPTYKYIFSSKKKILIRIIWLTFFSCMAWEPNNYQFLEQAPHTNRYGFSGITILNFGYVYIYLFFNAIRYILSIPRTQYNIDTHFDIVFYFLFCNKKLSNISFFFLFDFFVQIEVEVETCKKERKKIIKIIFATHFFFFFFVCKWRLSWWKNN
jgi:hypothetical protein